MGSILKVGGIPNWENVSFVLIQRLLVGSNPYFDRSELMSDHNIEDALRFLYFWGHKDKPKNPHETLQRTIQNLRDKGYIVFWGDGKYELTKKGFAYLESEEFEKIIKVFNFCLN